MKKKILFMIINMNVGGTEKALLNMLEEIDNTEYDVTVMMLEEYGDFLEYIPKWVKVKYLSNYDKIKSLLNISPQITVRNLIRKGKFIKGFYIGCLHLLSKIKKERSNFFKYVLKDYEIIDEEYDVAVAYAGPMDFITYYVTHKIKARKKIQWIHFDVTKIVFNKVFACKYYNKFDNIFVVSNEAKQNLDSLLPNLKEKTEVFLNLISERNIKRLAEENIGFNDNFDGIRILTVGRLAKVKGQDLTIPVLAKLKQDGYKVRWYCIGEGDMREEYERLIKKYNITNDYILLGSKVNPYPFIKECDIYVQSSRHEGYCITLGEAKYFKKLIVTTNFTGASEHAKDSKFVKIVDIKKEKIYESIKQLLDEKYNPNLLITNNLNEGGI